MKYMSRASRILGSLWVVLVAGTVVSCGGGGGGGGDDARVRLLNLSAGYTALDLLSNIDADDDDDDIVHATGVAYETVSQYYDLEADDYTLKLRRTGSSSTLRSFTDESLVEDSVYTYVAFGDVGAFGAFRIDDTIDQPDAGKARINVINISSAGALDFYLTAPDVNLIDTTPTLYSVAGDLNMAEVAPGTYRLRATAAGDSTDVRLDLMSFAVADRSVGTLILTTTTSGMLVNATHLPQGGAPAKLANTKARVRGAVAVANGANATIRVGNQTILTAAAPGVIGNRYFVVDAGTLPVSLSVNGVPVTVPEQVLRAGNDYTLMAWTSATGAQISLIPDDNRRPTNSGNSRIRLLNGMSTLATPLTLSLDFSPLVEGIELGAVSDEVDVAAGTERQVDISNTNTAATVLTRTGLTISTNSVYTYFVTDSGATPIGVLRKDR
jgi:hypothetical protein